MAHVSFWSKGTLLAWAGGIFLPLAMLAIDPAVFRGDAIGEGPILGAFAPGCYFGISFGMLALGFHLLARPRSAVLRGVLSAAACFAILLGLVLLPFGILGSFAADGVGVLGFSPFLTALVFGAQAKPANPEPVAQRRPFRFWLGVFLYVIGCVVVQALAGPPYQRRY
jgi:hypothetical protein